MALAKFIFSKFSIEVNVGPDRSDGTIIEIDNNLAKAYIQDSYEDTIFQADLPKYTGEIQLSVGTKVEYFKLYYSQPTAHLLGTTKEFEQNYSNMHSKNVQFKPNKFKQMSYEERFTYFFYIGCVLLGMIIGLFD